jgi:hypothetical protein
MPRHMRFVAVGSIGLATGLALAGCAGPLEPTPAAEVAGRMSSTLVADQGLHASAEAEVAGSGNLFFPLDVGNHWGYARTFSMQIFPTGSAPEPPLVFQSTLDADLVGTEERFGREYVVQLETYREEGQDLFQNRFLYRQDPSGLYNADPEPVAGPGLALSLGSERMVSAATAAASDAAASGRAFRQALVRLVEKHNLVREMASRGRASFTGLAKSSSGPLEGEIALLQYPLRSLRSWHVREDPLVVNSVESRDALELPAGRFNAWRIRIDWPGVFGPNDRAHVWYGRSGLLELIAHFEGDVVDENGNILGRVVSDEVQVLSNLSLVDGAGS